ncbi:MAG TPA: NUDIX hydrolase [Polyangiaceae bacterium]|nr:NUDIX hydrolase [Polyangiaceae bacterium]
MPLPPAVSNLAARFSVFDVREVSFADAAHPHPFHVIDCPDWVAVVAITDDDHVVLVRQYRAGIDALTVEPPGGVIEAGQTPAEAARRELLEETGYDGPLAFLGTLHPNPAILSNRVHVFRVLPARKVAEPTFDGSGEHCEVLRMPIASIGGAMQRGEITHVIGLAALSAALDLPVAIGPVVPRPPSMDQVLRMLEQMEELQRTKVIELARRIRPGLTAEDIRNPHDFPDLDDPDWHYADGNLSGIQAAVMAVRALRNATDPHRSGDEQ